jgi:small subunit ribosomal protein S6
MSFYECVFIVRQDVPAAQVESLTTDFSALVVKGGGKVEKIEQWGLRTLAFRMNKNKKGHYVLFNLDAPSAAVVELERNLRLHEDVLRFQTVRVEALDPEPSAILRKEEKTESSFGGSDRGGDRGDRPRRAPRESSEGAAA